MTNGYKKKSGTSQPLHFLRSSSLNFSSFFLPNDFADKRQNASPNHPYLADDYKFLSPFLSSSCFFLTLGARYTCWEVFSWNWVNGILVEMRSFYRLSHSTKCSNSKG
ncbi:hypothetical protein CDAR_520581 [Caerostris darwini]|uniref:Uncharacterized protein n=1 Tax=Caerostris darwini TaxID=1538125 RepID=A0AAV4W9F5_9ARAC|nr:hypothetical protein CDAR_520581 [Caerostris darwini]